MSPSLSLAIDRLQRTGTANFAVWVIRAPDAASYVIHDCIWPETLTHIWRSWQEMFSSRNLPDIPHLSGLKSAQPVSQPPLNTAELPLSVQLMQNLGIRLWQWLFDGPIQASFNRSYGIAIGQTQCLRLRLDIRDPTLIALPWEIMQAQVGQRAIALSEHILFSRTTHDVDNLPPLVGDQELRVLVVQGSDTGNLKLEEEAAVLSRLLQFPATTLGNGYPEQTAPCHVTTLVQPTPDELIKQLESESYNVLFYAGHGAPAPDGGLLFLRSDMAINGTELAQVLVRCRVKLAVFNACWSAQPDQQHSQFIPRSSLAEVLIHHGVPAVLGMRDSIADQEALSFIQDLAQALRLRMPIDQAVANARQYLLTRYRFNHSAWTLPVLYMHPDFDGELLKRPQPSGTVIPFGDSSSRPSPQIPKAILRMLDTSMAWQVHGGRMRIGREREKNDVVISDALSASREHAEIFYRMDPRDGNESGYFLKDFSKYGTWILGPDGWKFVQHREVPLPSNTQLRFGAKDDGYPTMEFQIIADQSS